jgi:hypothetical protein
MKVKVTHKFKDKHTGILYAKGEVLEITGERYQEIASAGNFVQIIPDDAASDGFDEMSIRELKEYADQTYKLTFKGGMKKSEIIEVLRRREKNG